MTACTFCGQAFTGRVGQRFCGKSCAGRWQYRDRPRRVHKWGKRPSLGTDHRKLRAALLPQAIGTVCVLCRKVTLTSANSDLDHVVPRARGGTTTRDRGAANPQRPHARDPL